VVVLILKLWLGFVVLVMSLYAIRHYRFTHRRLYGWQRLFYQDIVDADLPSLTVMVPMHDEEAIAERMLRHLLSCDYPADRLEVLVIDDHSTDSTAEILDRLAQQQPRLEIIHLTDDDEPRGKPQALNRALQQARGDVVLVFDADYFPARGALRDLAVCFKDPEGSKSVGISCILR